MEQDVVFTCYVLVSEQYVLRSVNVLVDEKLTQCNVTNQKDLFYVNKSMSAQIIVSMGSRLWRSCKCDRALNVSIAAVRLWVCRSQGVPGAIRDNYGMFIMSLPETHVNMYAHATLHLHNTFFTRSLM